MNFWKFEVSNEIENGEWDEKQVINRLKKGDESAFALLVRRFQARLFSIAYAMTRDSEESRDIVQEVFLKAHRSIDRFKGDARLSTWLHRITVNECLNWRRRWRIRRRGQHLPLMVESDDPAGVNLIEEEDPESRLRAKEMQDRYLDTLQALPEKTRVVFVLKELEGMSYEQIGATLGLRRGTVASRLHNARRQLTKALQDEPGK